METQKHRRWWLVAADTDESLLSFSSCLFFISISRLLVMVYERVLLPFINHFQHYCFFYTKQTCVRVVLRTKYERMNPSIL